MSMPVFGWSWSGGLGHLSGVTASQHLAMKLHWSFPVFFPGLMTPMARLQRLLHPSCRGRAAVAGWRAVGLWRQLRPFRSTWWWAGNRQRCGDGGIWWGKFQMIKGVASKKNIKHLLILQNIVVSWKRGTPSSHPVPVGFFMKFLPSSDKWLPPLLWKPPYVHQLSSMIIRDDPMSSPWKIIIY